MESLYDVLGVNKDATMSDIKKSYHRKAKDIHPDKTSNNTSEEFIKLKQAYDILSDEEKRKKYDSTGSVDGGEKEKIEPWSIPLMIHEGIPMGLFFSGGMHKINYHRYVSCSNCVNNLINCENCKGQCFVLGTMGPFVVKRPCPVCLGNGKSVSNSFKYCSLCEKGLIYKEEIINMHIQPGVPKSFPIQFNINNQGHINPLTQQFQPLILFVVPKCNETNYDISLDNTDVKVTIPISLSQAIGGISGFKITLPTSKEIVELNINEIITPDYSQKFENKGYKSLENPEEQNGNLYIKFKIIYPQSLQVETRKQIVELLTASE